MEDGSEKGEIPPDGRNNVDADSDGSELGDVAEASRRHGGRKIGTGTVGGHG